MKLEKIEKDEVKNIRIRYFFIEDEIEAGEIFLKCCPTEKA